MKKKKGEIEGVYQQAVDLVMTTYLEKFKIKYPFHGRDGKIIKWVLSHYGVSMFSALWQEFLERDWDWYDRFNLKHPIAHDLMTFRARLTQLLEDGGYKKKMEALKDNVEEPVFDFGVMIKGV